MDATILALWRELTQGFALRHSEFRTSIEWMIVLYGRCNVRPSPLTYLFPCAQTPVMISRRPGEPWSLVAISRKDPLNTSPNPPPTTVHPPHLQLPFLRHLPHDIDRMPNRLRPQRLDLLPLLLCLFSPRFDVWNWPLEGECHVEVGWVAAGAGGDDVGDFGAGGGQVEFGLIWKFSS